MAGMNERAEPHFLPCKDCKYSKPLGGWTFYCTHPDQPETSTLRNYETKCNIGKFEKREMK